MNVHLHLIVLQFFGLWTNFQMPISIRPSYSSSIAFHHCSNSDEFITSQNKLGTSLNSLIIDHIGWSSILFKVLMMWPESSHGHNEYWGVGAVPMSGKGTCDPPGGAGGITGWGSCAFGVDCPGLVGPISGWSRVTSPGSESKSGFSSLRNWLSLGGDRVGESWVKWWWVYPSDTLLWPSIFDFLSFSLHRRFSDIYCADATFSDHHANLRDHRRLYPIPITPSVRYHVGDLSYDLWTTSLHFPFLVFSLYPMHSSAVWPIADHHTARSGPYHMFCHTRTLCSFYLSFVFKTFVSTPKKKEVFPQNSDLSLSCLIVSPHSIFTPLHLCTFALSHTSKTLCCIAPSWTSVLHHFALLDTTSGDHFTAPELHPSEPHRIYT